MNIATLVHELIRIGYFPVRDGNPYLGKYCPLEFESSPNIGGVQLLFATCESVVAQNELLLTHLTSLLAKLRLLGLHDSGRPHSRILVYLNH